MILLILIAIATFIAYFPGISPSVFGADSGDIILASWFGGVAHPPGYPLNSMIGWVFTHLPYNASIAFKANLMAAFFQALGVAIVFLIIKKITENLLVSLAASLTLAFTTLFWLYAHVAEVFQLSFVLVGLSIYFLLLHVFPEEFSKIRKKSSRYLLLSVLFLGLAVFHHHQTLLLIPPVIYLLLNKNKKLFSDKNNILRLVLTFLIGLTPYIFTVWAAFRATPANWDNPSNFEGFFRLITRADYGTFSASQTISQTSARDWFYQILSYFGFVKADFSILGIFILIGAIYLFYKKRILFNFFTSSLLLVGPIFLIYAGFPFRSDFIFGVVERFILISYLFLAIFLAYGFLWIVTLAEEFIKRKKNLSFNSKLLRLFLELLLFLVPFSLILINWGKTDLSNYKLGDYLGIDVLNIASPNSVILLFDDTVAFNTRYVYYTNDDFDDKKIILGGTLKHPYYREQVAKEYPSLKFGELFLSKKKDIAADDYIWELVKNNPDADFYSVGTLKQPDDKKWLPWGITFKLSNKDGDISSGELISNFEKFKYKGEPTGFTHFIPQHIKSIYVGSYLSAGYYVLVKEDYNNALYFFNKARKIDSNRREAILGEGGAYLGLNMCSEAEDRLQIFEKEQNYKVDILEKLAEFSRKCEHDEGKAKAYEAKIERLKEN